MPNNYDPDNDATAGDPWSTAFLSDRDVSGQVPINYVPHPGVHLTPACFPDRIYDDQPFKKCLSNLLASEIRRFILDVYWDTLSRQFRLCPVQLRLPPQNESSDDEVSPIVTRAVTTDTSLFLTTSDLAPRQESLSNTITVNTSSSDAGATSAVGPNSTSTALPPLETALGSSGNTLYEAGSYTCSSTIDIDTFAATLREYILETSNTIEARLQLIIFNLHVSSDTSALSVSNQVLNVSDLPGPSQLISNYLQQAQAVVYTPATLDADRSNLNNSWYAHGRIDYFPSRNYFSVDQISNGDVSTENGWPDEDYVQLEQGYRFLTGFGSVDPQMANYNFSGDSSLIFSPGTLSSEHQIVLDSDGRVTSGCLYNQSEEQVDQLNASWAVADIANVDQSILGFIADNITICGMSPILNTTLNNKSADVGYEPYQTFGNQALFSWASGQPSTNNRSASDHSESKFACALMVSNNDYEGHWRVAECSRKYRVACREDDQPFAWTVSEEAVPFTAGVDACTGNSSFDVPRTGLENLYLYHRVQSISTSQQNSDLLDGIWINFNSIDVPDCWITTGPNGTCPYFEDADAIRQRQVLTPAIAALVILLLTALTILVKCNTNRRNSKIRKRGEGGWDYEGVPS